MPKRGANVKPLTSKRGMMTVNITDATRRGANTQMQQDNIGCGGWLLLSAATLFLGSFFFLAVVTVPVSDTSTDGVDVTLVLLTPPEASDAEVEATAEILAQRLITLGATQVQTEITTENSLRLTVDANLWRTQQQAAIQAVQQPGRIELLDFSGVPTGTIEIGQQVVTTGAPSNRLANADIGEPFPTLLTNEDIQAAEAVFDDTLGQWQVDIAFTPDGAAAMESHTSDNLGEVLAIAIDGEILSMPVVQSPLSDEVVISGNFTEAEARALAVSIGGEVLPFPLELSIVESAGLSAPSD